MSNDFINGYAPTSTDPALRRAMQQRKQERAQEQKQARIEASEQNRAHMRQMIQGGALIADIQDISKRLQDGVEPHFILSDQGEPVERVELHFDRTRVSALKASADLKLRLLNKVLPDLASVQLADGAGEDLQVVLMGKEALV